MADLRTRLQEIMQERNMSQNDLKERIRELFPDDKDKCTKSMISDLILRDRAVSYKKVIKMAKALDVSTDYLLGVSDVYRTSEDDVNISASVTGLHPYYIQKLRYLEQKSRGDKNRDHIYDSIESVISALCALRTKWAND